MMEKEPGTPQCLHCHALINKDMSASQALSKLSLKRPCQSMFTGVFVFDVYFGLKIGGQKLLISRNMIQERHVKKELN